MARSKKYTDQDAKLHPIVKALKTRGFTGIEVTWQGAMSSNRGWTISTHQRPHLKYVQEVPDIVKIIMAMDTSGLKISQYRHLKFKGKKELEEWIKTKAHRAIFFAGDQDLQKIIVDSNGEILDANLQSEIWDGRFINLTTLTTDKPIQMWNTEKQEWQTMERLVVEEIIY